MSEPIDTGGSAFPVVIREELEIAGARRQVERVLSPGLSARDYFAAHAMAALIAKFPLGDSQGEYGMARTQAQIDEAHRDIACSAYGYADAMLAERKRGGAS